MYPMHPCIVLSCMLYMYGYVNCPVFLRGAWTELSIAVALALLCDHHGAFVVATT